MRPKLALGLLAAYLFCRAALGATLNPLYNGPDEGAHIEYVTTMAEGRTATGAEARQLPAYYALAALPWRATEGSSPELRSFAVRLISAAAGVVTLAGTWWAARRVWPGDLWKPVLTALWLLAPGHLFLLASVNNDPLVSALSTLSFLAALHVWHTPAARRWWLAWAVLCGGALAVKPTALPVVLGAATALTWRWRARLLSDPSRRFGLGAIVVGALAVNIYWALQPPTLSAIASLARYWPAAVVRAPVAYMQRGGMVETFRTWWYGFDYLVRWPILFEVALAALCLLATLAAIVGLFLAVRRTIPAIVWACAASQITFVLVRYGFADVLQIDMGGAAQAKAFFTGIAPLALLGAAGIASAGQHLSLAPRTLALGLFATLLAVDAASLALTTWHHYRWWQVGA